MMAVTLERPFVREVAARVAFTDGGGVHYAQGRHPVREPLQESLHRAALHCQAEAGYKKPNLRLNRRCRRSVVATTGEIGVTSHQGTTRQEAPSRARGMATTRHLPERRVDAHRRGRGRGIHRWGHQ